MRGLLVTATDTEVGKTYLAAAICAALARDGRRPQAHKPVVTGLDEPIPAGQRDHELLAACTGQRPEQVSPLRFAPPVSPHLAAERAGTPLDPAALVAAARAAAPADGEPLVVEGIGGLLVPFTREGYDVRAFARDLGLPLVVAARPGLGTINHTRLTVAAARAAGLDVRAVVLTPWTGDDPLADDNRATLEGLLDGVPVHGLPPTAPEPAALARAAAGLPVAAWVGPARPAGD
ncbi:dethiobiotin synthase [Patulibacter defluvii]|uniref:dethiobiotin synthase n=1 Tax=Patulibacter defluvii TaxID=3095358 RepID=UPI002A7525DF|nr:dethiobiotin synthase [Patulibacter sp. DM4]